MTMWDVEPYTLDLSSVIMLSDDDLLKVCAANPDLRIERTAGGQLEIMSPSGSSSSACEAEFVGALHAWNEREGAGIVFTASGGFRLPNGAVRAADAAWVRLSDWKALTSEQQDKFAPVVPGLVVEVRSPSDRVGALRRKMEEWIRNGCRLAWLIDPIEQRATIFRSDGTVEEHGMEGLLSGEDVLPGFVFDLSRLKRSSG
jgi:Uma2 family endonuclease